MNINGKKIIYLSLLTCVITLNYSCINKKEKTEANLVNLVKTDKILKYPIN
jgi:hypothetical protein